MDDKNKKRMLKKTLCQISYEAIDSGRIQCN